MKVNYKGMDSEYNYRTAEITYDEKEFTFFERTSFLMRIKGWAIDSVCDGYALCEVDDREQYKAFMEDWKESKKCIKDCMKFGF